MPTHYRGRADEVAALDAYIKLMRAADSVTARLEPVMTSAGLTLGQFGTLEALLHLGPLCQRDLGRKLLRSDGNVTVVVSNLAQRGLVRRVRRRDDRRFVTVSLTARGRRLIETLFPRHVGLVVREMAPLSRAEQAELGRLCRLVGRRLQRDAGGARGARAVASSGGLPSTKEIGNGAGRDTLRVARAL
jgi:MarR family 2-MHQ and catechol resistance regulon transcriptional repressor